MSFQTKMENNYFTIPYLQRYHNPTNKETVGQFCPTVPIESAVNLRGSLKKNKNPFGKKSNAIESIYKANFINACIYKMV